MVICEGNTSGKTVTRSTFCSLNSTFRFRVHRYYTDHQLKIREFKFDLKQSMIS